MTDVPQVESRRWFRLTPDRLVLALLAVEGFLLLSERFGWFAFNRHKGWTMLIALANVAATLLLMLLWFGVGMVFRRRFQFSIRSLLLLTAVVAIMCSWFVVAREQARKQREAVKEIADAVIVRGAGAVICYDYELNEDGNQIPGAGPPVPFWVRNLLGDDLFGDVVQFDSNNVRSDAILGRLEVLTELQELDLGGSAVRDASMRHFRKLTKLKTLGLGVTEVSDAGLVQLEGLTQLESLDLSCTKVSDAGLRHLKGLSQLQSLNLMETKVTDAGLEYLERLAKLKCLWLGKTKVSDAGLEHLKNLTQLTDLYLMDTEVTDAGVERLKGLSRLEYLQFDYTEVGPGQRSLKKALPKLRVNEDRTWSSEVH